MLQELSLRKRFPGKAEHSRNIADTIHGPIAFYNEPRRRKT